MLCQCKSVATAQVFETVHLKTISKTLQRVWALGPKRTGPNFLLSSDTASSSSTLFSVPDSAVVRLSAKQEKKSGSHPAQADIAAGYGGPQQVEDPSSRLAESAEADSYSELSAKVRI